VRLFDQSADAIKAAVGRIEEGLNRLVWEVSCGYRLLPA